MIDFQTLNRCHECLAICEQESRICESHLEATRQAYLQCKQIVLDQRAKVAVLQGLLQAIESEVAANRQRPRQRFRRSNQVVARGLRTRL